MTALSSREFAEFNRLLATAVERSVPVESVLDLFAGQVRSRKGREGLEAAARALRDGTPLPGALAKVFDPEYCALVRAGHESGRLPEALRCAASYHALRARIAGKFLRFGLYVSIGLLFCVAVFGLGIYLSKVASDISVEGHRSFWDVWREENPLVWLSENHWIVFGGACGLLILGMVGALAALAVSSRWRAGEWIPVWGRLLKSRDLTLLCTAMAMKSQGGRPLPEALEGSALALGNRYARRCVREVRQRALDGESLSTALFYQKFFPRTLAWAVAMGEERGEVSEIFGTFSRLYASELERDFEVLFLVLTPVGLLMLGNAAFCVALGVLAPFITIIKFAGQFW